MFVTVGEEEPSGKVLKSRIPRPAGRLGKIQVFGLLQSGDKGQKTDEDTPSPSPTQVRCLTVSVTML